MVLANDKRRAVKPSAQPTCMPRIPGGRFSAVLLALGGRLVLFVPAAGAGSRISPRHPIEAAAMRWPRARRPPPSGRLARCRGERHCARVWTLHQRRHHVARVPGVPSQGLDLVEPLMYLSWTDD